MARRPKAAQSATPVIDAAQGVVQSVVQNPPIRQAVAAAITGAAAAPSATPIADALLKTAPAPIAPSVPAAQRQRLEAESATLAQLIVNAESLPPGYVNPGMINEAKARRAEIARMLQGAAQAELAEQGEARRKRDALVDVERAIRAIENALPVFKRLQITQKQEWPRLEGEYRYALNSVRKGRNVAGLPRIDAPENLPILTSGALAGEIGKVVSYLENSQADLKGASERIYAWLKAHGVPAR